MGEGRTRELTDASGRGAIKMPDTGRCNFHDERWRHDASGAVRLRERVPIGLLDMAGNRVGVDEYASGRIIPIGKATDARWRTQAAIAWCGAGRSASIGAACAAPPATGTVRTAGTMAAGFGWCPPAFEPLDSGISELWCAGALSLRGAWPPNSRRRRPREFLWRELEPERHPISCYPKSRVRTQIFTHGIISIARTARLHTANGVAARCARFGIPSRRQPNRIAGRTRQRTSSCLAPYVNFTIHEPKRRCIKAAPFTDRVVHHALCNIIEPAFERSFITHSYADRVGKGTRRSLNQCQRWAKQYRCCPSVRHPPVLSVYRPCSIAARPQPSHSGSCHTQIDQADRWGVRNHTGMKNTTWSTSRAMICSQPRDSEGCRSAI